MERREIVIRGIVQGVGFRPFVYGLASRMRLAGQVRNNSSGVHIEIEGEAQQLDQFLEQLRVSPPPLAKIEDVKWWSLATSGERSFRIEQSEVEPDAAVTISPDVGTCDDCMREILDPAERRYGYAFTNCTNCGPRLTIVMGAPYDRQRTTMRGFEMCDDCRREYEDPANRRFHAQPIACPRCGPTLMASDADGTPVDVDDPISWVVEHLRAGHIAAIKGIGGYHLACDAHNQEAVKELRRRKHRDEKPFAVMVRDVETARMICDVSAAEEELLLSPQRPIVLLKRKDQQPAQNACAEHPDELCTTVSNVPRTQLRAGCWIAPNNPNLGVMLPYTPLHHLIFSKWRDSVTEVAPPVLVMTSGNRSDEPIATGEPEVFEKLRGIADVFLAHSRGIHVRCDDSVVRVRSDATNAGQKPTDSYPWASREQATFIRRSRGYAPAPIRISIDCRQPILAVGGQLKNTFALGRGRQAIVSHHIGDLDHYAAYAAFERDIELYKKLFEISPNVIAHDLHPDYGSTRYATKQDAQLIPVQHHHAHMAACMAENGLTQKIIGVCFDGTGYGLDGAIWGGEFLLGDLGHFQRAAHLRYVPLPGGDRAIKEPWRIALSYLLDAGIANHPLCAADGSSRVRQMIEKHINSPATSSMGRLFDAVAAIIGLRTHVSFEGQAAMELESIAQHEETNHVYEIQLQTPSPGTPGQGRGEGTPNNSDALQLDARPMIRQIVSDFHANVPRGTIARKFHNTLARLVGNVCETLREQFQINDVALSGGCFMNALLSRLVCENLSGRHFRAFQHHQVPCNDGGISFGQVAVAAARLARKGEACASESREKL